MPQMPGLPKLLYASDIARVMGWQTQRARKLLKRTGAGQKRGNRYVTTVAALLANFPEIAQAILAEEEV